MASVNPLVTPQKRRSGRSSSNLIAAGPPSTPFDTPSSSSSSCSSTCSPSDTLILTPSSSSSSSPFRSSPIVSSSSRTSNASPFSPGASTTKRIKLNITPTKPRPESIVKPLTAELDANPGVPGFWSREGSTPGRQASKGKKAQAAVTARRAAGPRPSPLKNGNVAPSGITSNPLTVPESARAGSLDLVRSGGTRLGVMPVTPPRTPVKRGPTGNGEDGSPGLTFSPTGGIGSLRYPSAAMSPSSTSLSRGPSKAADSIKRTLPPHLQTLLLLNNALDLSLSLHMAMHPPLLPCAPTPTLSTNTSHVSSLHMTADLKVASRAASGSIDLPDVANFLHLKGMVERTCGKRFGVVELRRLVWIWGWDGRSDAAIDERLVSSEIEGRRLGEKRKRSMSCAEDDEGIVVMPSSPARSAHLGKDGAGENDEVDVEDTSASPITKRKVSGRSLMSSSTGTIGESAPLAGSSIDKNPFLMDEADAEDGTTVPANKVKKGLAFPMFHIPPPRSGTSNIGDGATNLDQTIAFPHHALSHILNATRTVDPTSNRRVYTYGFGIRVELTAAERFEMGFSKSGLTGMTACSPSGKARLTQTDAAGDVTSSKVTSSTRWVGRWSAGAEKRGQEVERRLWAWVERNGESDALPVGAEQEYGTRSDLVYTPSSSTGSTGMRHPLDDIPQIPMADLPALPTSPASGLLPAFVLPGLRPAQSPSLGAAFGSTSPRKAAIAGDASNGHSRMSSLSSLSSAAEETDVFGPVKMIPQKKVVPGSVADRRQAMYDRIKARQGGGTAPTGPAGRLSAGGNRLHANMSASERQTELKRMSTLSRLESVAEGVWMFFSNGPANGTLGSPGSPKARRKAFPMHEVVDIVVKSSKTPISSAEAKDSLALLTDLCPTFLIKRVIARQEWLEMPAQNQVVPLSPRKDLVGPASPGKVSGRTMGLREVRERIRKELGEW